MLCNLVSSLFPCYCLILEYFNFVIFFLKVSIIRYIKEREIRIATDAGRTSRPLLIVENNKLLLKKRHIELLKEREYNNYGSAAVLN